MKSNTIAVVLYNYILLYNCSILGIFCFVITMNQQERRYVPAWCCPWARGLQAGFVTRWASVRQYAYLHLEIIWL